jgi:hypothetical protein
MSILLKTHKLLWGRSGNKCAMENCRNDLIAGETETDNESIIGDEAHIVAKSPDGPRGISELTPKERDEYDNLVLLCRKHHKIVDDQHIFYTIKKLKEIKQKHEEWVKVSLHLDKDKEKDELSYASYIDAIIRMFDFENWNNWTSALVSHGQPAIKYKKLKELQTIPDFIISRFWPNRYEDLEAAIFNIKNVLSDFINVFYKYADEGAIYKAEESGNDRTIRTINFYSIENWNPELYKRLVEKFEYHVSLIEDLSLELTRAANLLIEKIRKYISQKYREEEGKLLISSGPCIDLGFKTFKVEYKSEEKKENYPYRGLKFFMTDRINRDMHFGEGVDIHYVQERFER